MCTYIPSFHPAPHKLLGLSETPSPHLQNGDDNSMYNLGAIF